MAGRLTTKAQVRPDVRPRTPVLCKTAGIAFEGSNPSPATTGRTASDQHKRGRAAPGDLPERFVYITQEQGHGPGPFGAKGIGEGGMLPVASAISNAVFDAVGVRITELPLSPERVLAALEVRDAQCAEG
jgi:hypothetical protein